MPRRSIARQQHAPAPSASPEQLVHQVRRLLAEAQALSARLAALNEVAVAVQASLDADAVLTTLAREARWVLDFQYCSVALAGEPGYREHVLKGARDAPASAHALASGVIGQALAQGQAVLRLALTEADHGPPGMQSAMIVPLRTRGVVIGSLNFFARAPHRYTLDDLRIASALAVQVAAVFQNARLFTAVTQARDELTTVLESISDGVLVYDVAGRILLVNTALRSILNLPAQVLTGRRALALAQQSRSNGQRLIARATLRALGTIARTESHGTLQLGDGRHLEWTRAPLSGTGTTRGFVVTIRDVSDRMALEQLRNDLIGMLVHDLRTPLTSVIMGLDMLRIYQHAGEKELCQEVWEQVNRGAHRLLRQVNAILDVRQLEAGRLTLEYTRCSLPELIQRVCTGLAPVAQAKRHMITLAVADDLPLIALDCGVIERVIENLLGNALKFTPPEGQIIVRALLVEAGRHVEVTIEDSGPGIPNDMRASIFELYGQAPGAQQRKGSGIGLTFCKLAVEAHQGQIGVRSSALGGSLFWFRLPLHHLSV